MTTNIEQPEQVNWKLNAWAAATTGYHSELFSRRGLFILDGAVCYYDNAPCITRDGVQRRDGLLVKLREWLEQCGLKEMASISYPKSGPTQGFTFAMVIFANGRMKAEELESTVRRRFQEITREFDSRLPYDDLD